MTEGRRPQRVAEDIRDCLAVSFSREIADPRLAGTVVSRVETSPDLGLAKVYVRSLQSLSPRNTRALIRSLERAAGRLRRSVASQLRLKRVPELRFFYDEGPDARARVEELLDEIRETRDDD